MRPALRAGVATALGLLCWPALAEPVADFYRGKTVRFMTGYGPGTGYDVYMRVVQRHIGAHIPGNPTVVPENIPGAGGLVMANALYNVAPRDGAAIGLPSRNLMTEPLFGNDAAKFDALKFNWIGSVSSDTSTCLGWRASGAVTLADVSRRETKIGGNGPQTDSAVMPRVLNALIGTRFKVFNGYPDSGAVGLAMENGEVDGYCGFTLGSVRSSRPQWLEKNLVSIIAQMAPKKHPDLPDTPNALDLIKDEGGRKAFMLVFGAGGMGRPVAAPPGVPQERVAALRKAFDDTLRDPAFVEDVRINHIDVDGPTDGASVEALIAKLYATPKEAVEAVRKIRDAVD